MLDVVNVFIKIISLW